MSRNLYILPENKTFAQVNILSDVIIILFSLLLIFNGLLITRSSRLVTA